MRRAHLRYPADAAIVVIRGFVTCLPREQAEEQGMDIRRTFKWTTGTPMLTHNENVEVAMTILREELARLERIPCENRKAGYEAARKLAQHHKAAYRVFKLEGHYGVVDANVETLDGELVLHVSDGSEPDDYIL